MTPRSVIIALAAAVLSCTSPLAQAARADDHAMLSTTLDAQTPQLEALAMALWAQPELGYLEHASSRRLQEALIEAGFKVESGIAGMPTSFVARAGNKGTGPVLALLAEMDALPGASQVALPHRAAVDGQADGHACGHNLFGAGAVVAAIAIGQWLQASGVDGEIRLYGTPAEEGGSGKVYLAKAGVFDDVDVVLHWHPAAANSAAQDGSLANVSGKFRFEGVASHAAISPERGRSALDGVEALNFMANLMREHVPDGTRIHYTVSDGGGSPNVVPATAEAYYYVRHADHRVVSDVLARLRAAAEGAALGTGTQVQWQPLGGVYGLLPNDTLGRAADMALRQVGGVEYSPVETEFARAIQATLDRQPALESAGQVGQYRVDGPGLASTDVGDVSWQVPTVGLSTATWVPGTAAHSWQATAASGHAIGVKGTRVAAETLALLATRLYRDPELVARARAEFERRRGKDGAYRPLVERQEPPLDYRLPARNR